VINKKFLSTTNKDRKCDKRKSARKRRRKATIKGKRKGERMQEREKDMNGKKEEKKLFYDACFQFHRVLANCQLFLHEFG
jgi:hypothetical protein